MTKKKKKKRFEICYSSRQRKQINAHINTLNIFAHVTCEPLKCSYFGFKHPTNKQQEFRENQAFSLDRTCVRIGQIEHKKKKHTHVTANVVAFFSLSLYVCVVCLENHSSWHSFEWNHSDVSECANSVKIYSYRKPKIWKFLSVI